MNNQIEKTPLEKAFESSLSHPEELRKIAIKCYERSYITFEDYTKICEANQLLIF
jgi:hypothetical protein